MAHVTSEVPLKAIDLSAKEAAELFCEFNGEQMAEFFSEVWQIAKGWNGTGWCQQSYSVAQAADQDCRNAITTLDAHFSEQESK